MSELTSTPYVPAGDHAAADPSRRSHGRRRHRSHRHHAVRIAAVALSVAAIAAIASVVWQPRLDPAATAAARLTDAPADGQAPFLPPPSADLANTAAARIDPRATPSLPDVLPRR
jgi:hypothetical protein